MILRVLIAGLRACARSSPNTQRSLRSRFAPSTAPAVTPKPCVCARARARACVCRGGTRPHPVRAGDVALAVVRINAIAQRILLWPTASSACARAWGWCGRSLRSEERGRTDRGEQERRSGRAHVHARRTAHTHQQHCDAVAEDDHERDAVEVSVLHVPRCTQRRRLSLRC